MYQNIFGKRAILYWSVSDMNRQEFGPSRPVTLKAVVIDKALQYVCKSRNKSYVT